MQKIQKSYRNQLSDTLLFLKNNIKTDVSRRIIPQPEMEIFSRRKNTALNYS